MLDKLRSQLVHFGPSLISVPVKLAPFALKRQVLEQVLSWQFRQALADGYGHGHVELERAGRVRDELRGLGLAPHCSGNTPARRSC